MDKNLQILTKMSTLSAQSHEYAEKIASSKLSWSKCTKTIIHQNIILDQMHKKSWKYTWPLRGADSDKKRQ